MEHVRLHASVADWRRVGPSYVSSRYTANNNLVEVGGYVRWDVMAAYHQKRYDIQLNVLNLMDKKRSTTTP